MNISSYFYHVAKYKHTNGIEWMDTVSSAFKFHVGVSKAAFSPVGAGSPK